MVQIDVSPAIQAIQGSIGRLTPRQVKTGISRALNHTMAKAQTAASRTIRATYNIRARDIKKAMKRIRARYNNLETRIDLLGAPLPIIAFGARQTKRGVSVAILKGQRKIINRAFIATMRGGHKGVYARGEYDKGGFQFRAKRVLTKGNDLPITEIRSVSVPQTLANDAVMGAIAQGIRDNFAPRLDHELSRLIAGLPALPTDDVTL